MVELQLVKLYSKLIGVHLVVGGSLLVRQLRELVIVEMKKEVCDSGEQFDVLIRVIVSEGLTVCLISKDADQTEPIHPPFMDALALLSHVDAAQHPGQLLASQLNHTHIVQLLQLCLETNNRILVYIDRPLIQYLALVLFFFRKKIVPLFSYLQNSRHNIRQFIQWKIVAIGDEAIQIGTEILNIEQFASVDLPLQYDVFNGLLDLDEAGEADDVLH